MSASCGKRANSRRACALCEAHSRQLRTGQVEDEQVGAARAGDGLALLDGLQAQAGEMCEGEECGGESEVVSGEAVVW